MALPVADGPVAEAREAGEGSPDRPRVSRPAAACRPDCADEVRTGRGMAVWLVSRHARPPLPQGVIYSPEKP